MCTQVYNDVVMALFSNNTNIVTFVLAGYGVMLPCMHFVHLALLDHSTPDYEHCMVLNSHVQCSDFILS